MEVNIESNNSHRKKNVAFGGIIGLAALVCGFTLTQPQAPTINLSEAALIPVKQADVELTTQAFGELVSAEEMILTSQASGRVKAIFLRPGAQVTPETVVLSLVNPELEKQYQAALGDLRAKQAAVESFELEQQNALLDSDGRRADIQAALEEAQLNLRVYQELRERGVTNKLEIMRAELAVKQEAQRLTFETKKHQQFAKMQTFQLKQQRIQVEQLQRQVNALAQQIRDMQVTAGINGTLQALDIKLGETVKQGVSLGRVGSETALLARLKVPQSQADQVEMGTSVQLSTAKGKMRGRITRVESVVTNGMVLAEAEIESALAVDARPSAAVTGQIFLRTVDDATYIPQTPSLRANIAMERFVIAADQSQAEKRSIQFGESSDGKTLIRSGVKSGEYVLPKMPEAWKAYQTLAIK